jgi:hypothetical protein
MTTQREYTDAYRRELRKREADGTLAGWRPLKIGTEREAAPRFFRRAVAAARAAQRRVGTPARAQRPRARREARRTSARTGTAPPDADPHLAEPASGISLAALFGYEGAVRDDRDGPDDRWGEPS